MIRQTPEIQAEVNRLYAANGHSLTPDIVIAAASSPSNTLHGLFEWDDAVAANMQRRDRAREIIACVTYVHETSTTNIEYHAYVHDPRAGKKQGYKHVVEVRSERDVAEEVLLVEFQRVADLLRRCRELAVALGLESKVDKLLAQVGAVKEVIVFRRAKIGAPRPDGRREARRFR